MKFSHDISKEFWHHEFALLRCRYDSECDAGLPLALHSALSPRKSKQSFDRNGIVIGGDELFDSDPSDNNDGDGHH